jgi:hypothetical protein
MAVIIELLLTISMLNAELPAQGKDALRFFATWPYENAGMSSDITTVVPINGVTTYTLSLLLEP